MIALRYPKQFQAVQRLPFCYLCGEDFSKDDSTNRDHVPPRAVFSKSHRVPLILTTHEACNASHKLTDEKMGQLVGLRRGEVPSDPTNRRLRIEQYGGLAAITNVDVHGAVWRWMRGFHAALYKAPAPLQCRRAIELPFQRARRKQGGGFDLVPLRELQHRRFVQVLKENRLRGNVDCIHSNAGKMTYECVWAQNGPDGEWGCVFALNVYDWKDLGAPSLGQRGCAGVYTLPDGKIPEGAARAIPSTLILPNYDPLDPFGR